MDSEKPSLPSRGEYEISHFTKGVRLYFMKRNLVGTICEDLMPETSPLGLGFSIWLKLVKISNHFPPHNYVF